MAGGSDVGGIGGECRRRDRSAAGSSNSDGIKAPDVAIAGRGQRRPLFTLACLREAKRRGALTIGIANNRGTPILTEADCAIWLDTGPEPIAGSTRMKAGTAQRVALAPGVIADQRIRLAACTKG